MVVLVAAAFAVIQQVSVQATVDRDEVALGDTVVLTVTVNASGSDPVTISEPTIQGLSVYGTQDRTSVQIVNGTASRVTSRLLFLRAVKVGTASIGAITVEQGSARATTLPIALDIVATDTRGGGAAISAVVKRLIDIAKPPEGGDEVTVSVLVSDDTLVLGSQVDLLVAAWFPRDVRLRLRSSPTLEPPVLEGAWAYRQVTPVDVAASRNVSGRWYDLFVHHQAVFPLVAGTLEIGSATVSYSVPVSFSFLSREIRREVKSRPESLWVLPQPVLKRPKDFGGTAGRNIRLTVNASNLDLTVGQSASVAARVEGIGNISLWPAPRLKWPAGLRVYPGEVTTNVTTGGGPISGSKTFTYVVVPDSAGTLTVPSPAFPYFDTGDNTYKTARTRTFAFRVRHATGIAGERRKAPPLLPEGSAPIARRITELPDWLWVVLLLLPPLLSLGWRIKPAVRLRPRRPATRVFATEVEGVGARFENTLVRLVPESGMLEGRQLADALMAAGVEPSLATHAGTVKERLRRAVYGPGGVPDSDELVAEVREVINALTKTRDRVVPVVVIIALLGLGAGGGDLRAQTEPPEALYGAGAYGNAADSFAVRAHRDPWIAAHWYNLGGAMYAMGRDGSARAAWARALRLAPHSRTVREALSMLPDPDPMSRTLLWVSPITWSEAMVAGVALWFVTWTLVAFRRRAGRTVLAGALAVVFMAYGVYVKSRYDEPVAVVVGREVDIREAPYNGARPLTKLPPGSAARIESIRGAWMLVSRGALEGWVQSREVEVL